MRKRIGMALVSLLAAVGGVFAIASPAQAVSCPSGYICFFNGSGGTSLLDSRRVSNIPRTVCQQFGSAITNRTSYIKNNSGSTFHVYDSRYCDSTIGTINPWSEGPMTGIWNDSISSFFKA